MHVLSNHTKRLCERRRMNKKLLIVIGVLVVVIVGLGGYIVGNHSSNESTKTEKTSKSEKSNKSDNSVNSSESSSTSSVVASSNDVISTSDAESQLNNGQSIDGKTVDVEIFNIVNASELGQNIQAGEHLNFYPTTQQYNLKAGDHVKFKVISVKSTMGSWLITGDVVK